MLGIVCQICTKRPATSHLTEIHPQTGARQELHICATCVAQLELNLAADPPSIASVLARKDDNDPDSTPTAKVTKAAAGKAVSDSEREANSTTCPTCGLSFAEFAAHNRFGCAQCYTAFTVQVEPLLERYHGTAVHTGRVPAAAQQPGHELIARRARLDSALREAVKAEQYEQAARLRDELRQLDEQDS